MPRHRRSDNREGVTRIAAKACRIRQHWNDPAKICERTRPTVREQQRDWIGALALDVNIVKIDRVDLHRVLSELIQCGFVLAPVVLVAPIVDERPEILQIDSVVPSWRNLIRPAHVLQSLLQIHKRRVRHCDPEWFEEIWLGSGRHWNFRWSRGIRAATSNVNAARHRNERFLSQSSRLELVQATASCTSMRSLGW